MRSSLCRFWDFCEFIFRRSLAIRRRFCEVSDNLAEEPSRSGSVLFLFPALDLGGMEFSLSELVEATGDGGVADAPPNDREDPDSDRSSALEVGGCWLRRAITRSLAAEV